MMSRKGLPLSIMTEIASKGYDVFSLDIDSKTTQLIIGKNAEETPMENTPNYSYEIHPRAKELGGGYQLRLLEGSEEVGGGVFPAESDEEKKTAYEDAMVTAQEWLETRNR